jgi:hypothetical protein
MLATHTYQLSGGNMQVEVLLEDENVWLTIDQMAMLYGKSRATVNEHILNIFKDGELAQENVMRKIGISDFSTKPTNYYNSQFKRVKQTFSYSKKLDNCRRQKTARWIQERLALLTGS